MAPLIVPNPGPIRMWGHKSSEGFALACATWQGHRLMAPAVGRFQLPFTGWKSHTYGGLLYYPIPRQSLSHNGAAFIYTRIASELACQDREVQAGSVSIDTGSLAFINYRALLAKVGDTAPGQESVLPYGTSALLASS